VYIGGRPNVLVKMAQGFNLSLAAWAIISMAPTNPATHEADEAQEMLRGFDHLRLAETVIRERPRRTGRATPGSPTSLPRSSRRRPG
jgi:hypothetical protein